MKQVKTMNKKKLSAYEVTQALVGIEFGKVDDSTLAYFDFFTKNIPVSAAYFVHVLPADIYEVFAEGQRLSNRENYSLVNDLIERTELKVNKMLSEKENMYVEYDILAGDPLEELLKSIKEYKADLLVIGQKKKGEEHKIRAQNLVRKTKGNALIIPEGAAKTLSNILVPIDFSDQSIKALRTAMRIKRQSITPIQITCLYIYTQPDASIYGMIVPQPRSRKAIESKFTTKFNRTENEFDSEKSTRFEVLISNEGIASTADYIFNFAKNTNTDFVVMGAKGHSKVDLLLLGSVTENFMRINNEIPTLIVK